MPNNTAGFKFIVTGVTFDSFTNSTHTGAEPRTMLGYTNGKLYMVALKAETPGSAQTKMAQIMGLSTANLNSVYQAAFFLDSDTSTYICSGGVAQVNGGGTPTASFGIKGTDTPPSGTNGQCSDTSSLSGQPSPLPTTTAGSCQINCNQSIPDSSIPSVYLGQFKNNFVDLANRWTSNTGKNYAKECYNDVIKTSINTGVNPVFSLAIWLHESGASNYTSNVTSCVTQDFGINGGGVSSANFSGQLAEFLRLPQVYKINHPQCFTGSYTDMQNFYHIYRSGANLNDQGICGPTPGDLKYNTDIQQIWGWITNSYTSSCSYPSYPTAGTCN